MPLLGLAGQLINPNGLHRNFDCSLSGIIPVVQQIGHYFEFLSINFLTSIGNGKRGTDSFYFSDSLPRRRSNDLASLFGDNLIVSYVSSPIVGPFYLATLSGKVKEREVLASHNSWTRFEKDAFCSVLEKNLQIKISRADDTNAHDLPPEPELIADLANQYPEYPSGQHITYFKRSFQRRKTNVSLSVGFDANLAPALSNIELINYFAKNFAPDSQ